MEQEKKSIEQRFSEQRKRYTKEILDAIPLLNDIKTLTKAKVTFLSLRQVLLEESHSVFENYNKLSRSYREKRSMHLLDASSNLQVRLNEREKEKYIDGLPEMSKLKSALDILDTQSKFLQESMKTVDQVLFGLKVRIDTEKILNGI
jgi:hypothetical protein